ncbi:MAG: proprotein convertase P-domain-containing protein, partial [Flavobacteriales bacterium]|nr:proprotein convertase P-domain-containing protein [Flavobacteriales bacterium]
RKFLLTGLSWLLVTGSDLHAQGSFPFTSGPIPQCDTSAFTANVSGVGVLEPGGSWFGLYLESIEINITSDHPETLEILLTSPQGTTIVLSAFNGAGGQNYTSTLFPWYGGSNITSGSAPFSGSWWPQNGSLGSFDYENANGTWT